MVGCYVVSVRTEASNETNSYIRIIPLRVRTCRTECASVRNFPVTSYDDVVSDSTETSVLMPLGNLVNLSLDAIAFHPIGLGSRAVYYNALVFNCHRLNSLLMLSTCSCCVNFAGVSLRVRGGLSSHLRAIHKPMSSATNINIPSYGLTFL